MQKWFLKIIFVTSCLSENLERNIKLWESGTQPDDQASPTPNVVSDDDGHQTVMTVNEIPADPVALCGLSVVAPRDDGSDDNTNIAIGGDLNAMSVQAGWESRVFSHHIGGSEKRSLAWDGDGGRRSIGLSIFAGYEPHEANSCEISEGPPLNTVRVLFYLYPQTNLLFICVTRQ